MGQESTLTDQTPEKKTRLPLILGLAGLFLILAMTAMLSFYPFHYTRLNGEARVENHVLYLKNNSDYEWKDVRLLLNTDYKLNLLELAPHTESNAELSVFKKDDGSQFDNNYSVVDLYVTAVTPEKQTISNIFKLDK